MNANTQNNQSKKGSAPPFAYVLVTIGGGVIGRDYAGWLEVDPVVGAGIGGIISMVLTNNLYHLYADPDGKIRETYSSIGLLIGLVGGGYITSSNPDGNWIVGSIVGGIIGAIMGQMAATIISLAAFFCFF